MPAIEVSEAEFVTSPHRRPPRSVRAFATPRYWRVPLRAGASSVAVELRPSAPAAALAVVLHGLGDDATYPLWPWLTALAERGIPVVAFDWDGHGVGGDSRLDFDRLGESVGVALTALVERDATAPRGPIALAGHSTGALAAALHREAELAAGASPHVRHYCLVSPALGLAPTHGRARELAHLLDARFLTGAVPAMARVYGWRGLWPAVGRFRREEFPVRLARPDRGSAAVQLDQFTRRWRPRSTARAALGDATCTVHFGERDAIVDVAAARARLEPLFSSVHEVPHAGLGHWGMAFHPGLPARLAREIADALGVA